MSNKGLLQELAKRLTDEGKLIEAGWIGLRIAAIPHDAPAEQLHEMRQAFFAGAMHLFSSIMSIMESGDEATENDLRRMDQINKELDEFGEQLRLRVRIFR